MPQIPVVFLVDDDASVVRSVSRLLKLEGYEARSFQRPADFLKDHDPSVSGCIILDVVMPGMTGLDLQKLVGLKSQPIIFISGNCDVTDGVAAMKAGAVDFLTKPFDASDLLAAVRAAVQRDKNARNRWRREREAEACFASLSEREKDVFRLVVLGRLNKQIAAELGIAEKTVKVHRGRLMRKMHAHTIAQLVNIANRLSVQ